MGEDIEKISLGSVFCDHKQISCSVKKETHNLPIGICTNRECRRNVLLSVDYKENGRDREGNFLYTRTTQ